MSLDFGYNYSRPISTRLEQSILYHYFSQVSDNLPKNMTFLQSMEPTKIKNEYQLIFEKVEWKNISYQIKATSRFSFLEPSSISMLPSEDNTNGNTFISSHWNIETHDALSHVDFEINLKGNLPVPKLMGALVRPLLTSQLNNIFDNYVYNTTQEIQSL